MDAYKPRVISLTKKPNQTFGFYLRVEYDEEGHLIRCLEMGGPAELAGMKDGDRVIRVNGAFVDGLPHSEVSGVWGYCGDGDGGAPLDPLFPPGDRWWRW